MQRIFALKVIPVELKKKYFFLFHSFLFLLHSISLVLLFRKKLSLCFSSEKQRWSIKSTKLSHTKRFAQIFWTPNRGSTTSEKERKSENIGQQWKSVPKIWFHGFFLHNVWIYWLILDLVVLHDLVLLLSGFSFGFMGFFYVSLICVFLFHFVS